MGEKHIDSKGMIEVKETEDKEKVKNLNCRVGFIDKVVVFIEENCLKELREKGVEFFDEVY